MHHIRNLRFRESGVRAELNDGLDRRGYCLRWKPPELEFQSARPYQIYRMFFYLLYDVVTHVESHRFCN